MALLSALMAGLMFGIGLIVSGMTDPGKVQGFLDLTGQWNPSLILVMGGAIAVALPAFRWAAGRAQTWLGLPLQLPSNKAVDARLLLGAASFGAGWGLTGFCPGPALVAMAAGSRQALLFTLAMLAGMAIFELMEYARRR